MANLIRGQQLADAPLGITTSKINDDQVTSAKVDGTVLSNDATNTPPANDYSALGKKILSVADGTLATDAVNLGQLQAVQQGMAWKAACETGTVNVDGTTTALPNAPIFAGPSGGPGGTLTSSVNAALTVGGVAVSKIGLRVLVTGQANDEENGIYQLTQVGSAGPVPPPAPWILTRAPDMDINAEVPRAATTIDNNLSSAFGRVYVVKSPVAGASFSLNDDPITWVSLPLPLSVNAGPGITVGPGPTVSVDIIPFSDPAAKGLGFDGNKLVVALHPNRGLIFDPISGGITPLFANTPNVKGGISGDIDGLFAKLAPNTVAGGGLSIGPLADLQVAFDPLSSGFKYTVTGIAVNTKTAVAIDNTGALAVNNAGQLIARVNALTGAIQINAVNEIELKVAPNTPTGGGFQINGVGEVEAKWDPAGGITYSAVGGKLLLGNPANLPVGLLLSAAGVYNNVVNVEQSGAALATTVQGEALFGALTETPFKANGKNAVIFFFLNGVKYRVGPSIANDPVYFSNDGGVTARALNAITVGDIPYRGGAFLFPTLVSDEVNIDYLSAVP